MDKINWERTPLIPAIVQDYYTNEVLMLAYMNKEAYELSLQTSYAHYYSRSRQSLWKKGESSGNTQKIKQFLLDCDNDTILLKVEQTGVACHTGRYSCFYKDVLNKTITSDIQIEPQQMYDSIIDILYHTILERKDANPQTSWTAKLFAKGENTILKKVAEEASELCFAIKDKNQDEIIYECADLVYHTLVALAYSNISPQLIKKELQKRFGMSGIEEKKNRKE
jgi:phosphoribosyl-ATP pyrophosphohydrolase/phosphoribosyl-AMP cyclohydrolase